MICMVAAGILFARSSRHRDLNSNKDDANHSIIRRDIVENYKPEKHAVVMASPPMYLDGRDDSKLQISNLRPSLVLLGLGRAHHNDDTSKDKPVPLRWAILGAGRIAHDFTSVLISSGCTVNAVAAMHNYNGEKHLSALSRAESFANLFSIPKYYGTYEELAQDTNVDIVYIATTNQNHLNPTLLMLQSGKNVLVEKPSAVTYEEAKLMYDEAEKRGLFLMTNHWTRFFPAVKYLRAKFLEMQSSPIDEVSAASKSKTNVHSSLSVRRRDSHHSSHHRQYNLGSVLAMHGDFGFPTPLDPSDRFLNRTLGGGVTLDVGCYLVELAMLAAYDHHQSGNTGDDSIAEAEKRRRKLTSNELQPDEVIATGHGMYNGLEFPVDVESSFSMRWGGKSYGIWNGECDVDEEGGDMTATSMHSAKRRGCHLESSSRQALSSDSESDSDDTFTMLASFQASFRRPSTFEVEYVFERGRVVLHGPGNCPNKLTIYESDPFGLLIRETTVSFKLPIMDLSPFGRSNYPRAEGFVYVIDRIEECMAKMGVPGRSDDSFMRGSGCLEVEENSIEEQLATVEITERVLKEMNYFS